MEDIMNHCARTDFCLLRLAIIPMFAIGIVGGCAALTFLIRKIWD